MPLGNLSGYLYLDRLNSSRVPWMLRSVSRRPPLGRQWFIPQRGILNIKSRSASLQTWLFKLIKMTKRRCALKVNFRHISYKDWTILGATSKGGSDTRSEWRRGAYTESSSRGYRMQFEELGGLMTHGWTMLLQNWGRRRRIGQIGTCYKPRTGRMLCQYRKKECVYVCKSMVLLTVYWQNKRLYPVFRMSCNFPEGLFLAE